MDPLVIAVILLAVPLAHAEEGWKTVDEKFRMSVPVSWQKQKVKCFDSNCGTYKAKTADLEFDEVFGLGYTAEKAQVLIDDLKKKEANPKLLKPGEEVWHVDGRIARFRAGKVEPKVYGKRRFSNVADLDVPYAGEPGYLSIYILYKSDKDLQIVRRVLQSLEWKKKSPTKARKENEIDSMRFSVRGDLNRAKTYFSIITNLDSKQFAPAEALFKTIPSANGWGGSYYDEISRHVRAHQYLLARDLCLREIHLWMIDTAADWQVPTLTTLLDDPHRLNFLQELSSYCQKSPSLTEAGQKSEASVANILRKANERKGDKK